ncbi:MAG: hypothetical protein MZV63_65810 [Marinilabiliales bacterium]|nr:hypothetical protein [Marinilabiliales bacterium]
MAPASVGHAQDRPPDRTPTGRSRCPFPASIVSQEFLTGIGARRCRQGRGGRLRAGGDPDRAARPRSRRRPGAGWRRSPRASTAGRGSRSALIVLTLLVAAAGHDGARRRVWTSCFTGKMFGVVLSGGPAGLLSPAKD